MSLTDATPGAAPEVSVILVNWNTADLAIAAIASLKRHETAVRTELIVVDNASAGDDGERILREHPDVRLIRSDRNRGFAGGNNLGAGAATGEFLLLLNTDTLFTGPVLSACLTVAREHAPAIVGCRLRNADGSLQASAEAFPSAGRAFREPFGTARGAMRARLRRLEGEETRRVDWVCGAFLLVPRATYLELGGLSEAIFMYGEDTEFCWRARARGVASWYVPRASLIHYGGGGTDHASLRGLLLSDAGRLRSFALMRGPAQAVLLRGLLMFRSAVRSTAWDLAALLRKGPDREALRRKARNHRHALWALAGIRRHDP